LHTTSSLQEISCSYDDIDLVIVIKIADGARILSEMQSVEQPFTMPPSPLRDDNFLPDGPADPHAPTLAFVATFPDLNLPAFDMDMYIHILQSLSGAARTLFTPSRTRQTSRMHCKQVKLSCYSGPTEIRILATQPVFPNSTGVAIQTAMIYKKAADLTLALQCQSLLVANPASIFDNFFGSVNIDPPRVAGWGYEGCLLTQADCAVHGILHPAIPKGCMCRCNNGWQNAKEPTMPFYCAGGAKLTWYQTCVVHPQSLSVVHVDAVQNSSMYLTPAAPPSVWRAIPPALTPAPKDYSSNSWSDQLGVGGWLGIAGGITGAGNS
jgi:hypothetical protein